MRLLCDVCSEEDGVFNWRKIGTALTITCAIAFAAIYIFCAAKSDMSTSAVRLWGSIAAFSLSELLLMGLIASLQTPILAAWLDYIDGFRLELAGLAAMLFALAVAFTKGAFWAGL